MVPSDIAAILYSVVLLAISGASPPAWAAQAPVMELDHAYILVPPGGAAAIHALLQIGIVVDTEPERHDGEGTTSIAAFFENAYLELMWVDSTVAVDSAHQVDMAGFRRGTAWSQTGASPFGIGLHFLSGSPSDLEIPFQLDAVPGDGTRGYYVLLRQPVESLAPDVFVMPPEGAVTSWIDRYRGRRPDLFAHPAGPRRITRVVVKGSAEQHPLAASLDLRLVTFEDAKNPTLFVEFDGGRRGKTWDLRPSLPLVLTQ